ncbi:MAG TPA: type II CAAX endopeptidase family protein [Thermoanaerobaculia bacterium]|jgi:hypothetical protein
MKRLFIGPHGLRAGYRFVLYVVLVMFLQGALQYSIIKLAGYQPSEGFAASDFALSDGVGFAVALLVAWVFARYERRSVGSYGMPLRGAFGVRWWEGMLWGTLAVLVPFAMVLGAGGATVNGFALHGSALARAALVWLGTMIILGLYEEFFFRGYVQNVLTRAMGFWPAAILLAILFGALHYFGKPMENWVDFTTVTLLGLFMAFTLKRTGNLWFAAGFHTAFDYLALNVVGAPNTGNHGKPLDDHLLATQWTGPEWVTGGVRGLEASYFMFLVIAALFALAAWRFRAPHEVEQNETAGSAPAVV